MSTYFPLTLPEQNRIEEGNAIYAVIQRKIKGWIGPVDQLVPILRLKGIKPS